MEQRVSSFSVRFTDFPEIDGNHMQAKVKMESDESLLLNYWIQTEQEKITIDRTLQPGHICKVDGTIEVPSERRNPNAFNYRQYLLSINIRYILSVDKIKECFESNLSSIDRLKIVRENSMQKIEEHFPEQVSPFVNALLFGGNENMNAQLSEAYQSLGISHLLAISGLHVTILTALLYYLLMRFGMTRESVRNVLLFILPIYAVLSGASPSVNRAVIMAWIILFLSKWKHRLHPLDALGLSFILFVLHNPYIIYHAGFQLSFLVTASLLLSGKIIQKTSNLFTASVLISFLAQLSSFPIILYHFYEFSILSLIMNILYVPLYSNILLPLSILAFAMILMLPHLSDIIIEILIFLFTWANSLAEKAAMHDPFLFVLGKPPEEILILYYICIIAIFIMIEKYGLKKVRFIILLLFIPTLLQIAAVKYSPIGEVTFLDVGQGDSIFIRLPFNQGNYLIDTGGILRFEEEVWRQRQNPFDPGKDIVLPFLKSKGLTKIDKLILTHGDIDHIGSARAILENMEVNQLLVGKTLNKKEFELEMISLAKSKGTNVFEVYDGLKWEKGNYKFFIISPEEGEVASNDSSVVLYAMIGDASFLFTGDLESEGEARIINRYPNLKADVLKIGHHGSKTSSSISFLKELGSSVSIISAGENNRFGHPHQEVLNNLQSLKIKIYRTDQNGAVIYTFFMNKGKFSTMLN